MCPLGEERINKQTSEETTDVRIDGRENYPKHLYYIRFIPKIILFRSTGRNIKII